MATHIGITGATGQLGRLVIPLLHAQGVADTVIALVRSPAKAADLGVAVREADYDQPATLDRVLAGIDTLLLISGSENGQRTAQHTNVIAAAQQAGVTRIIYTSVLHADTSPLSIAAEHRATEAALHASGVPATILRNGWYTENYAGRMASAVASGTLIGSAGDGKIASAARADYAAAAVATLLNGGHAGKTYELAGDNAYTLHDLAAEVARQSGKTISYQEVPEAAYAAALTRVGVPADLAAVLAGFDGSTAHGALFDDSHQLSALIGRPTTPLSVVVADALHALS